LGIYAHFSKMGSESRAKWPLYTSTLYKLGLKSGYSTLPSYFANKEKVEIKKRRIVHLMGFVILAAILFQLVMVYTFFFFFLP
jgi:hypothetical protein